MTPDWKIEKGEFLRRLDCSEQNFEERLCLPSIKSVEHIIPLRHIREVHAIVPLSYEMLGYLLRRMTTMDGQKPFAHAALQFCKVDSHQLRVGQKYAYREKYQRLLEELPGLLGKFVIGSGLSDLGAYFVFGEDTQENLSLACYIPPLVEQHGSDLVIMDGIHRNYIVKQMGVTMNAVLITDISVPFPCTAKPWSELTIISAKDKPTDIYQRYFDLKQGLFRDLKYLGIDG